MTLPNLITTIRILLAPVFIIYLINEQFLPALIIIFLCALSDGLDGMLARLLNQKSKLGSYLDPLADKILLVAAFVVLAARELLPAWLTVLVISRDIMILLGVLVLFLNGIDISIKPSVLSKVTTVLQFLTVIAVLSIAVVSKDNLSFAVRYMFWLTSLFTIVSGLHYMYCWFKMMGEGAANNR
jgi:cardiolipin synthase